MAIGNNNLILQALSGKLGNQLVIKNYSGKVVVCKYPDMSKRKLTPKQIANNELMKEAHYFAKRTMTEETLRMEAQVRLNVTSNKLYTSLIREYFQKAKEGALDMK